MASNSQFQSSANRAHVSDSPFTDLPDELVQAVLAALPLADLVAMDSTCKRVNELTRSLLEYRRHCFEHFKYWRPEHRFHQRLVDTQASTNWRKLLIQRKTADQRMHQEFESILTSQVGRASKANMIVSFGYDAKDFLLQQLDAPHDAADYLARTWWAQTLLSQVERHTALRQWSTSRFGSLERALACLDLCVVPRPPETLDELDQHFDRIASGFTHYLDSDEASAGHKTSRQRVLLLVTYLRNNNLLGLAPNMGSEGYHRLQNTLISIALCEEHHSSLPLVSAAIFCAVARRLGFDASPVNYPAHIYVVVSAGKDATIDLNGDRIAHNLHRDDLSQKDLFMYLDPFTDDREVSYEHLHTNLLALHIPQATRKMVLSPEKDNFAMLLRMTNNLGNATEMTQMFSVSLLERPDYVSGFIPPSALDQNGHMRSVHVGHKSTMTHTINLMRILFDPQVTGMAREIIRAAHAMLAEHYLSLQAVRECLVPVLREGTRERELFETMLESFVIDDAKPPTPKRRADITGISKDTRQHPVYRVGTYFQHRNHGYQGVIIGWDVRCENSEAWMAMMQVDQLPRGRLQPFYNVIDWEGGSRYVAEENIVCLGRWQSQSRARSSGAPVVPYRNVMQRAGEWFKRWDEAAERFVSNITEEYPEG